MNEWSNCSTHRQESVYIDTDMMPIFMIIALDIVITMRFSINCLTVICLPTVCFLSREKPLVKPMAPGVSFPSYIFRSINQKNPKIPCCNIFIFTLVCSFIYLLYWKCVISTRGGWIGNFYKFVIELILLEEFAKWQNTNKVLRCMHNKTVA